MSLNSNYRPLGYDMIQPGSKSPGRIIEKGTGKLLLAKGAFIPRGEFYDKLIERGEIEVYLPSTRNHYYSEQINRTKRDDSVYGQIGEFKERLGRLYRGIRLNNEVGIKEGLNALAQDIDSLYAKSPNALLGILQLSYNGYSNHLFRALHASVIARALSSSKGLDLEGKLSLMKAALTADIGFVDDQYRIEKYINDRKFKGESLELTDEQKKIIRKHPRKSVEFLLEVGINEEDRDWLEAVLYHHERLDGSGYYGKTEESLPDSARILAVADMYSAMVRPRLSSDESKAKNLMGEVYRKVQDPTNPSFQGKNHLDYEVVMHLINSFGIYPPGTLVQLNKKKETDNHYPVAIVRALGDDRRRPELIVIYDKGTRLSRPFLHSELLSKSTPILHPKHLHTYLRADIKDLSWD